jgi:beta-N-acetylhexosaminidase
MEESRQVVLLSDLSIEQKVGQMVIAQAFGRFRAESAAEYAALRRLVEEAHISGFKIYHGYALGTLMLTAHLDALSSIPLFFASDLEMGLGQQIVDAPRFPPASALGAAGSPELAFLSGCRVAQEALRLGINLVFAPLLDLHGPDERYFGLRCISGDPDITAEIGSRFLQGINQAGALSTAKYFPGNGEQQFLKDGSTTNSQERKRLEQWEWLPFVAAIRAGVSAVMVSHGAFPSLDAAPWNSDAGTVPAVLSRQVVTEILRKELGFDGLIITDALNLPFLHRNSMREIARHAVSAGSDLLVALTTSQDALEAIKGIYDSLDQGLVSEAQIDEPVRRILDAKRKIRMLRLDRQPLYKDSDLFGSDATLTVIEEIAQKSITLLKKPEADFPILKRPVSFLGILVGSGQAVEQIRPDRWQQWHKFPLVVGVSVKWTAVDPSKAIESQISLASEYHAVILVLLQTDAETGGAVETILNRLNECGHRVILGLPVTPNEAVKLAPYAWTSLWMPDFYQPSRQALLAIITGESQAIGRLWQPAWVSTQHGAMPQNKSLL